MAKPKNIEGVIAEIKESEQAAKAAVLEAAPFPEGHEAYAKYTLATVKVQDGWLATIRYRLKPGHSVPAKTGTGAVETPLERYHTDLGSTL